MQRIFIHLYFITLTTCAARRATHCNNQLPLLPSLVLDHRISSSSNMVDHTPSDARMSGDGWCASRENICEVESDNHYIQVDFGAAVVVEAIAIDSVEGNGTGYVTEYYVEYGQVVDELYCVISQESNEAIFDGVNICREDSDAKVKNFTYPVITRFIRVVPLEWEGVSPCLRMELYGCYVKECSQMTEITANASLLPAQNIEYSTYSTLSNMAVWCAELSDLTPNVKLNFTERVYLIYAVFRGENSFNYYVTNFSLIYQNSSNENVTYTDVDGNSFFGLIDPGDHNVLLWTPITATQIQLSVHSYNNPFRRCIGFDLYGCRYSEVIDHSITSDNPAPSTNITSSDIPGCSISVETAITTKVAITVTNTQLATYTTTLIITPSCATDQQTNDSECSCNAVAICIPVVVAIALIVSVIVFAAVWKCRKMYYYNGSSLKVINTENDLHGKNLIKTSLLSSHKGNEATSLSTTDLSASVYFKYNDSRREFVNPEYVTANKQQVKVIGAVTPTITDDHDPALTYNPAYDTVNSGPLLSDNPAYIPIKDGLPAPTDSDPPINQIYI